MQQTGGSTYIVSLPKQWADKVGIKPSSQLTLSPQPDGKLIIDPIVGNSSVKKTYIDITDLKGDVLVRQIIAAYLVGADILEIKSDKMLAEQKNIIREMCYKLIGPEIIEETAKKVIIKDLLNPNEISIKKSVRRMFLLSNSMQKDAIKAIKTNDKDLALDVIQRDDDVDRLFLLTVKQFRAVLKGTKLPDISETSIDEYHDLRMAANPLERIADHAQKIASIALNMDYIIPEKTMEMIEKATEATRKIVEDAMEALYTHDSKLANNVIERMEDLKPKINKLKQMFLNIESYDAIISLGIVIDSIERTGDYGSNIAEIAINSAVIILNE